MRINNNLFIEDPKNWILNSKDTDYIPYWKEQKRRCIDGFSIGGVWMPGRLYHYNNYGTIEVDYLKGNKSFKKRGRPYFRDIEWQVFNEIERAENERKGILLISGRGAGKSFWGAECIAHTFTFFEDSECVISSEDDKYINKLYRFVELNLNNQPLPFKKVRTGTLKEGIWNQWKDKKTGENLGTNSRILSRNYKNNSMAANGTRPKFHVIEEIGTMQNLKRDYQDSLECWRNEYGQFAIPFLIGTGGDMEKGNDAAEMFREPEAYNLISIEDEWETGTQISLFIPATKAKNEYKKEQSFAEYLGLNEDGELNSDLNLNKILVSNELAAKNHFEEEREKKRKATDTMLLQKEMMYNPFKPSEAFIKASSNRFNIEQLKHYLYVLETKYKDIGIPVDLYINQNTGKVESKASDKKPLLDFPLKSSVTDRRGSIVIYEYPIDNPPYGLYIGGIDPYDQEQGDSLGSIYIFKRFNGFGEQGMKDAIVAEFTGRCNSAKEFYEICRLLLIYYNAKALTENQNPGVITHFYNKHYDYLLADTPQLIKNISPEYQDRRSKGNHMSVPIKNFALNLIKEYLEEEIGRVFNDKGEVISVNLGYERVKSIPLLKELIQYDNDGNFDRVISFGETMLYREETMTHQIDTTEKEEETDFFADNFDFFRKTPIYRSS